MTKFTVACAALSGRIYAGRVNKAGTAFLDGKQDVTSDVLKRGNWTPDETAVSINVKRIAERRKG